jgi:hypothetical protein
MTVRTVVAAVDEQTRVNTTRSGNCARAGVIVAEGNAILRQWRVQAIRISVMNLVAAIFLRVPVDIVVGHFVLQLALVLYLEGRYFISSQWIASFALVSKRKQRWRFTFCRVFAAPVAIVLMPLPYGLACCYPTI